MSAQRFVIAFGLVLTATAAFAQVGSEPAALVNGTPILSGDIDAKLGNSLASLQEQIYALRQKQLDAMIDQKLIEDEAARRGSTIAALVRSEILDHVAAV